MKVPYIQHRGWTLSEDYNIVETLSHIRHKHKGERIGFLTGCFDLLHIGHVKCLEEARRLCDRLIVGVMDDTYVRDAKGIGRPLQPLEHRLAIIKSVRHVDDTLPVESDLTIFEEALKSLRPDCYVKGGDNEFFIDSLSEIPLVRKLGIAIKLTRHFGHVSTTSLVHASSTSASHVEFGRTDRT